jgi:hypothetical protein
MQVRVCCFHARLSVLTRMSSSLDFRPAGRASVDAYRWAAAVVAWPACRCSPPPDWCAPGGLREFLYTCGLDRSWGGRPQVYCVPGRPAACGLRTTCMYQHTASAADQTTRIPACSPQQDTDSRSHAYTWKPVSPPWNQFAWEKVTTYYFFHYIVSDLCCSRYLWLATVYGLVSTEVFFIGFLYVVSTIQIELVILKVRSLVRHLSRNVAGSDWMKANFMLLCLFQILSTYTHTHTQSEVQKPGRELQLPADVVNHSRSDWPIGHLQQRLGNSAVKR